MSFVKTLATLAAGFAAAKGYDKYKDMGGMPGVKEAMRSNPQLTELSDQAFDMMEKMGLPTDQLKSMREQFMNQSADAGSAAGIGALRSALGGGMAGGFKKMDKNSDGKLQTDELPAMMRPHLSKADTDGDGELSRAEFTAAMAKFRSGGGGPGGPPGRGPGGPPREGRP